MPDRSIRAGENRPAFERLPVELIGQITSNLDTNSIRALTRTNKAVHALVESHGWREYVISHFPSYRGRKLWRDAAHSLTRLSRAWETRALNARVVLPDADIPINLIQHPPTAATAAQSHRNAAGPDLRPTHSNAYPVARRHRSGQTMGYRPMLSAKEYWAGPRWTDRQEVLAVGAGAELLLRRRDMSELASFEALGIGDGSRPTGKHGHHIQWHSWRGSDCLDGRDDITALKSLDQDRDADMGGSFDLIIGRASGKLERIALVSGTKSHITSISSKTSYGTQDEQVMFVDQMPSHSSRCSHFIAGTGYNDISLYEVDSKAPVSRFQVSKKSKKRSSDRLWSSKFISADLLAVGHGVSSSPLDVYSVRPEGIMPEPLHRYSFVEENAVYDILPLSENTFLTGLYDGSVKVHDVRTRSVVKTLFDKYDHNYTVYSLLSVQPHLILAGTSRHTKVCVFDLRASGGLSSADNFYLGVNIAPWHGKSSVYSLARAGEFNPTFYAGLEGGILQLDSFSSFDKHPDPVFAETVAKENGQNTRTNSQYVSLRMLHKGTLLSQQPFARKAPGNRDESLDARWTHES